MQRSKFSTIFIVLACSLTFLNLSLSTDTLSPNQTINGGQTLISKNQVFVLGFFSPGSSTNKFLGIWYKSTPDVVVWVANRNNPIKDSNGTFSVTTNGTLQILSGNKTVIWSSADLSTVALSPVVQLLDNGNLILIDNMNVSSLTSYLWQSFDYPCDTRLPGMLLVDDIVDSNDKHITSWKSFNDPSVGEYSLRVEYHDGLVQMVLYEGTVRLSRSGPYNVENFNNMPFTPTTSFRPHVLFGKDRASVYDNGSLLTRLTIESSGYINRYTMNETRNGWNLAYTGPRDTCDNYSRCGPYGICRISKVPLCECFKGFVPRSQKAWDSQDYSGGCVRRTPLDCRGGDGFYTLSATFPDTLNVLLNASISRDQCQAQCYESCLCTAYATPFVTGGCLMWFGDLVDVREPFGVERNHNINIRLSLSELACSKGKRRMLVAILTSLIGVVLLGLSIMLYLWKRSKRKKIVLIAPTSGSYKKDMDLPLFDLTTILKATNNFSDDNQLGEGGFGPVYKGMLEEGQEIAVKRLSKTSSQGQDEFTNEVLCIAKLQHRNLVRLLGCCIQGEEKMLIYEYMPNKSLDFFLFNETRKRLLDWHERFQIVNGIARGLTYLHQDSRLRIIHRDLKASNILLDIDMNPKISDFGIARSYGGNEIEDKTNRVVGTYGYISPEYALHGRFSVKSDVFSFGVLVLEIVSSKRNRGFSGQRQHLSLLGHAWTLYKEGRSIELVDACLADSANLFEVQRLIHVALLCVQQHPNDRPSMTTVVSMLSNDGLLPQADRPGFFTETDILSHDPSSYASCESLASTPSTNATPILNSSVSFYEK